MHLYVCHFLLLCIEVASTRLCSCLFGIAVVNKILSFQCLLFFTCLLSEQVKSKAVCAGGENKVALHLCAATIIRFIFS